MQTKRTNLLGPFVGHTTDTSTAIWLRNSSGGDAYVQLSKGNSAVGTRKKISFLSENLFTALASFDHLEPDTDYAYRIYLNEKGDEAYDLQGLDEKFMRVTTMPPDINADEYRYDFLLLSCNNPDAAADLSKNSDGYEVWETLPQILDKHRSGKEDRKSRVLFALMGGDQIYADDWKSELLKPGTPAEKLEIYHEIYEHYWSNLAYRELLAGLPAYLMWDDHDIMDGWGSEEDSFETTSDGTPQTSFKPEWNKMFLSAKKAFEFYQASRNPERYVQPKSDEPYSFDTAFRIGPLGFVLADLRSKRNLHAKQFWTAPQIDALKSWVDSNRTKLEVLFFLTPVVFAHGAPGIEDSVVSNWSGVLSSVRQMRDHAMSGKTASPTTFLESVAQNIGTYVNDKILDATGAFDKSVGDLRDDIKDSWGAAGNESSAEPVLEYLFDLQNDSDESMRVHSVILTGDIHTCGYSNIYSNGPGHQTRPVIPQIVSSPVGYKPFSWLAEAIYRKYSVGQVPIGQSKVYSAQISHHHTERNVAICSVRKIKGEHLELKAKFYLEGYPEPQTAIFDLEKTSHLEGIRWKK